MTIDWSEVLPTNATCTHAAFVLAGKQSKGDIASFVVGTICVSVEYNGSYVVSTFSNEDGHLIKQTEWQTPLAAICEKRRKAPAFRRGDIRRAA